MLYKQGASGRDIKSIQLRLMQFGYDISGNATEYFGAVTDAAVREFQCEHKLAVDGIVGGKTRAALFGDDSGASVDIIRYGSTGDGVKRIQNRLIALGYNVGDAGADGVFGQNTYDAVLLFQESNNLETDGIVGPKTMAALFSDSAAQHNNEDTNTEPTTKIGNNFQSAIGRMIDIANKEAAIPYSHKRGYSKYGAWYGSPGAYWCNCFVSWCAMNAGLLDVLIPKAAYTETSRRWFLDRNAWKDRRSGYIPKKGDCIFFKSGSDPERTVNHIGLVRADSDGKTVLTVEGNLGRKGNSNIREVRRCSYRISDSYIIGYGILSEIYFS